MEDVNIFLNVFIGVIGFSYKYFFNVLSDKEKLERLYFWLEKLNRYKLYENRLKSILNKFDIYLGIPSLSINFIKNNIFFHYGLAIFYVCITFIIIWIIGGSNMIGNISIIEQKNDFYDRLIVLFAIIIISFVFWFLISRQFVIISRKFKLLFNKLLPNMLKSHAHNLRKYLLYILFLLGTYFIINNHPLIKFFISIFEAIISNSILYLLIISGIIGIVITKKTIKGFGIGVGIGVILVGIGFGILNIMKNNIFFMNYNISLFVFLIIIPFLNALFDFFSLTISRILSKKIIEQDTTMKQRFFHLFLDLCFAILFLIILGIFLYYGIYFFNKFIPEELNIPIESIISNWKKNPFDLNNIWITFMFMSTLIPTILHFLLGLLAIILTTTTISNWFIKKINKIKSSNKEHYKMELAAIFSLFVTFPSIILFATFVYMPFKYLFR